MCQPKPGPRCSAHARTALENKRAAKDAAQQVRDDAQAALRAADVSDRDERARLREVAVAADKAYWEAEHAHTAALRMYETTPEGMEAVRQTVEFFEAEGNHENARHVRARLVEAEETRYAQVTDLAMSRRHAQRLLDATPDETAALDQADAAVAHQERLVAQYQDEYDAADREWRAMSQEVADANRVEDEARAESDAARDVAIEAREAAVVEAKRLYVEAGVSPRMAGYYANDMADSASRHPRGNRYPSPSYGSAVGVFDNGPLRGLTVKVKRDGPDREKTLAAKAAAETDEAYLAANQNLVEAASRLKVAKANHDQVRAEVSNPINDTRQRLSRAQSAAKYALDDAKNDAAQAQARADDLRARIGSGLGKDPVTTVPMRDAHRHAFRNPDGTTNAYVYNEPSPGFPHGRYVQATGVTTVHGMSAANALVLENGRKAWLHSHYARTVRGAGETASGYRSLVVTEPAPGAVPLNEEGVVGAGFTTFIDSTD